MPVHTLARRDICPRCGAILRTVGISQRDRACSNPRCSYPNPEPGTIQLMRVTLKDKANYVLQELRERGLWPR